MTRVLSIWLPHLAIERWAKSSGCEPDACPERSRRAPVVLTVEGTHGLIIHAVTAAAAERGARPGARLTDARALDPSLIAIPADPAGDSALLQRLARWAERWSPLVEVDGSDGLRLDISGVAHLFGGEDGLVRDIEQRFAGARLLNKGRDRSDRSRSLGAGALLPLPPLRGREGLAAKRRGERGRRWQFGPSPWRRCASLSLSREGGRGLAEQLAPLHVSALRLDPDTVRTLERLGLKTIGALTDLPRLALARRFRGAEDVVDALDRLVGRKPEPLTAAPVDPPPRCSDSPARAGNASRSGRAGARPVDSQAGASIAGAASRRSAADSSAASASTAASPRRASQRRSPAANRGTWRACSRTKRRCSIRNSASMPSRFRRTGPRSWAPRRRASSRSRAASASSRGSSTG